MCLSLCSVQLLTELSTHHRLPLFPSSLWLFPSSYVHEVHFPSSQKGERETNYTSLHYAAARCTRLRISTLFNPKNEKKKEKKRKNSLHFWCEDKGIYEWKCSKWALTVYTCSTDSLSSIHSYPHSVYPVCWKLGTYRPKLRICVQFFFILTMTVYWRPG